jgi:hypothetical protein
MCPRGEWLRWQGYEIFEVMVDQEKELIGWMNQLHGH